MLIQNAKEMSRPLQRIRQAVADGWVVGFDTEFLSERRYTPQLCLLQMVVAPPDGPVSPDAGALAHEENWLEFLFDSLNVDLQPVFEIMDQPDLVKIVHSGSVDLQILVSLGHPLSHVYDTQIAAAFLGFGQQIGYVELVRRLLHVEGLSKDQQYSNWAARPLLPAQMAYALDDVRYLPLLHRKLNQRLAARGRQEWAQAEFSRASQRASRPDPDAPWRRFTLTHCNRRQLAALQRVARVREEVARAANKPPAFIVADATLQQIARQMPQTAEELHAVRGMPSLGSALAGELLHGLQEAKCLPEEDLPHLPEFEKVPPEAEALSTLMGTIVQLQADSHDIARSYLASRQQLVSLAGWWLQRRRGEAAEVPDLPLLADWRYELVGRQLMQLLEGKARIVLEANPQLPPIHLVEPEQDGR